VEAPWDSGLAGRVKKVRLKRLSASGRMSVELIK
jgi:hypothetical protein